MIRYLFVLVVFFYQISIAQKALWVKKSDTNISDLYTASESRRVIVHPNGSIYVIGQFTGPITVDGQSLVLSDFILRDIFLAKYSPAGDLIWVKKFLESVSTVESTGISLFDFKVDNKGDFIIHGYNYLPIRFLGEATGLAGPFIAQVDSEGNFHWIRYEPAKSFQEMLSNQSGSQIAIDRDNNVLWYSSEHKEDGNTLELSKYNTDGIKIWSKSVVGTFPIARFPAISTGIALDSAGNFILTGYFQEEMYINNQHFQDNSTASDRRQLFMCKLNLNGDFLWTMRSNFGTGEGYITSHTTDGTGNIYVVAVLGTGGTLISSTNSFVNSGAESAFAIKIGQDGTIIWAKPFPDFYAYDIIQASNKYLYLTGIAAPLHPYPWTSYQAKSEVIKIDTNGVTQASLTNVLLGYPSLTGTYQSVVDSEENIYTVGNFSHSIQFGCLPTTTTHNYSFFLVKHEMKNKMSISGPTALCGTDILNLQAEPAISGVTYTWHLPTGVIPVSGTTETLTNSITLNVSGPADHQSIFVSTSDQCPGYLMNPYIIDISATPPQPELIAGPSQICSGTSETFKVKRGDNNDQFIWTMPNDASVLEGSEPNVVQITFSQNFVQGDVTVVAKNNCGESSYSFALVAYGKPAKPLLSGPGQICLSQNSSIQYQLQNDPNATTIVWDIPEFFTPNGERTGTNSTLQLDVLTEGADSLKVHGINYCNESGEPTVIFVESFRELKKPLLEFNPCQNLLIVSTVEEPQWYKNDVQFTPTNHNQFTVLDSGLYYVEAGNFCGIQKSESIRVYPLIVNEYLIPNVITPNNDGVNDYFQVDKALVNSSLQIFNRWGTPVFYSENYRNDWSPVDITSGIYYYIVLNSCNTYQGWLSVIK